MVWAHRLGPGFPRSTQWLRYLPSRAFSSGLNEARLRHVASIIVKKSPHPANRPSNDTRRLDRISDQATYLVVRKPRKDNAWQFPQGGVDPGETVVQAALRELREECGPDIQIHLKDSHPCGSYKYRYPAHFQRWANLNGNKATIYAIMICIIAVCGVSILTLYR